jgi:hypothetical protein
VDALHRFNHMGDGLTRPICHLSISPGELCGLLCCARRVANHRSYVTHGIGLLFER